MVRPLVRDEGGLSTLWSFVGVLVLVIAILGVYYGYVVPKFAPPPIRSQLGDTVHVNYVGSFQTTGLVFDTSILAIGQDNASYPKAFSFTWHPTWSPLSVEIGAGGVVKGFEIGVQGLAEGESKTVAVPPDLGYGSADPAKFIVKSILEPVPVRFTMNASDFLVAYHIPAVSGMNVTDPFWGWSATVSVAETVVTVTNSPILGQIVHPYRAWMAQVVSIDYGKNAGRGEILVRHLLDSSSVDRVGAKDANGKVLFVVSAVNTDAGTYTLNYNDPTKGRVLIFQVTMVSISRLF
ncbi:MAG TPA: FKBP-type peptidyl-prolyl cis-trans isomerase [Thermoplasmata archaeon]|nr:FKBP-type peptidyl-prolyl cis-trans isomerase [Thermoplasmata archaeon]